MQVDNANCCLFHTLIIAGITRRESLLLKSSFRITMRTTMLLCNSKSTGRDYLALPCLLGQSRQHHHSGILGASVSKRAKLFKRTEKLWTVDAGGTLLRNLKQ